MSNHEVPRKSEEELREFVRKVLANEIFTSAHIPDAQLDLINMVFMPVALGAFKDWTKEEVSQIGVLYEEYAKSGPRSLNGFPTFISLSMLHIEDWKKAKKVIVREQERMKNLSLDDEDES